MKMIRTLLFIGGLVILALAFGFIFRLPLALSIWPWEDGRYSYLFVGSILAAVSAAALWISWTGELGALPAGSLNVFVIALTTSIYFFNLVIQGRSELFSFGIASVLMMLASGATILWSRRLPLIDTRPTPNLIRVSFGIFTASLFLAGGALVLRQPVFPWDLNPDSSVIFGCIFLGDAFYFLHALLRPRWGNACGQLLSFLAYDLVLIFPFVMLFDTVKPERMTSLVVYTAVLIYSGGLAVYYLFINPQTRLGSRVMNWDEYYKKIQGRAPRPLLLDALAKFPAGTGLHAIDLGCGDGTESAFLLSRGWHVLAVDGEPAAIKRLLEKVSDEDRLRLDTQVAKFKDVVLSEVDLLHASLSIPFCEPEHFDELWAKIVNAIKPGGRFAGQFFGERDSWTINKDMTFHTEVQVRALLEPFETEHFHEMDEDGHATSGPKHWHMFTVIARKVKTDFPDSRRSG